MCQSDITSFRPGGRGVFFEITGEPGKCLSRTVPRSEMMEWFRSTAVTKIIGGVHWTLLITSGRSLNGTVTALHADLWPRRTLFNSSFVTPTSQYRLRQQVNCSRHHLRHGWQNCTNQWYLPPRHSIDVRRHGSDVSHITWDLHPFCCVA